MIVWMRRAGLQCTPRSSAPTLRALRLQGTAPGANTAAVTALRVRDEGGPALCGQLLLYPVTDYRTPGTHAYKENAEGSCSAPKSLGK